MSDIAALSARGQSSRIRIAIAGGGIGGLALAVALQRKGFAPVVFERKPAHLIRTEGVFLTLAPNGVNALRAIGLAKEIAAAGIDTRGLALFNETGRELAIIDYSAHREAFGAPSVTIRRGALGSRLLDAAQAEGVDLRFETAIRSVAEDRDGVTVGHRADEERFDVLVACDGLRSTVRALRFPQLPAPRYSGLIGTGGFADVPGVANTDGVMKMTFGRRAFFGYIKAEGHPVYWFNTYPAQERAVLATSDPRAYARFIAGLHADDPLDNAAILGKVDVIDRNYPIYDMPELPAWSSPRVLLMGDAAHAVAPHSGQGASMALEDAVVLAACLADSTRAGGAFRRFETLRRKRTARAIHIGRMSGSQKHAQSWLALRIRDFFLPLVMPMATKAQVGMYGFRADLNPLTEPRN